MTENKRASLFPFITAGLELTQFLPKNEFHIGIKEKVLQRLL